MAPTRSIILHGGAGSWRAYEVDEALRALRFAGELGLKVLEGNGSALDAVIEAVSFMAGSGIFNAGRGSCKDLSGNASLDAGIMWMGRAGAVAYVKATWNAIRLARIVMEHTPHVLMVGDGADELARSRGLPPLNLVSNGFGNDTVGAVALDMEGRLASAVSTGGIKNKMPGRVGDSPIPGAGFWASRLVASCATGYGEAIIMAQPCRIISIFYEERGLPLGESLVRAGEMVRGPCGLIALTIKDEAAAFTTAEVMPVVVARSSGIESFLVRRDEVKVI
ncbi:MAG: isoaspartyl peptidase/L-asparaginase [Candidatus Nezhaarchaeales archaeon]